MAYVFEHQVKNLDDAATALSSILRTQDGYTPPTLQEYFGYKHAYQIFCTTVAFLRHVPISKFHNSTDLPNLWDRTTLATLARNIWDTYTSYRFYSHDPDSDDVFRFRQLVAAFIAETRRLQMLRMQNPNSVDIPSVEASLREAQDLLVGHPIFANLDDRAQKKLVQDKEISAVFIPHEILSVAGLETSFYRAGYRFLSNHSHFYSFALSQSLVFNINDAMGQVSYQAIIDYASMIVLFFLDDFRKWYPGSEYIWSPRVKDALSFWRQEMNTRLSSNRPD